MEIFRKMGRMGKFTVTLPLRIFGVEQLWRSGRYLGSMWHSVRNPICPSCESAVLARSDGKVDPEGHPDVIDQHKNGENDMLFTWSCCNPKCGFVMLGESTARKIAPRVLRFRNEHAKERLREMADPETLQIIAVHRRASRFYFAVAACGFVGFLYYLAIGARLSTPFSWLGIAAVIWLFGMKKSYHAWLLTTSNLFNQGTFRFWLLHEKWLI